MKDTISRQGAIEIIQSMYPGMPRVPWMVKSWQKQYEPYIRIEEAIKDLSPAQPEYEPVKAEDFAKTMSENTVYSFMRWYYEVLKLMERQGFVICKKTL